jgi:tetratricopeptide (TPR) repeat protein
MPFVRRKGGRVLLVHNERIAGESRVRQRELFRFSSAAELDAALSASKWPKWTRAIEWKERELTFDWDALKEKLAQELRGWKAAPSGGLHRRDGKVQRLATDLSEALATLSLARPADVLLVERLTPSLQALRDTLSRLLTSTRSQITEKENAMIRAQTGDRDSIEELFDQGMEHWWANDRRRALPVFKRVLKHDPRHADAHNHLGIASLEVRKLKHAEEHFRAAIEGGARSLERHGKRVPWACIENRPYLRALGNLALALAEQRRWREALSVHEELLRLNPDDNQGVRFLIGLEYLRVGDSRAALKHLRKSAGEEPGATFGFALALLLSRGSDADVGEALLAGFASNRYVAPMLLGVPWERLDGFYGTNMAEPEWAKDVIDGQADLWQELPRGAEVLRFWWLAPPVAAWRKRLDDVIVRLKNVHSDERSALVSQSIALCSNSTIKDLVRQVAALS